MNLARTDDSFATQVEQAKQAIRNADAERAAYIRAGAVQWLTRSKAAMTRLLRPKAAPRLQRI
jgi:hypothetical protein